VSHRMIGGIVVGVGVLGNLSAAYCDGNLPFSTEEATNSANCASFLKLDNSPKNLSSVVPAVSMLIVIAGVVIFFWGNKFGL
jgi:hypothetical protein